MQGENQQHKIHFVDDGTREKENTMYQPKLSDLLTREEAERRRLRAAETWASSFGTYQLSWLVRCSDPERPWTHVGDEASPGAEWLRIVADAFPSIATWLEGGDEEVSDVIAEAAADLAPYSTHELWGVFVDLGAYRDVGSVPDALGLSATERMEIAARGALYDLARRLLGAMVRVWRDAPGELPITLKDEHRAEID